MSDKYIMFLIDLFPELKPKKVREDAAGVGVIANKKQARDPRYSMSLTKDVRPGADRKAMRALKLI